MDSNESLFDLKDHGPMSFGGHNLLGEEHSNFEQNIPDENQEHGRYAKNNLENTPCDEERIFHKGKIVDYIENQHHFLDHEMDKEDNIDAILNDNMTRVGREYHEECYDDAALHSQTENHFQSVDQSFSKY